MRRANGDGMGTWADFFAAELSAAAALTGLVIVGISINVTRILEDAALPGRAAETLVLPTGMLVVATCALTPGQPLTILGWEILGAGLLTWLVPAVIQFDAVRKGEGNLGPMRGIPRVLLALVASWPFIVCGILLILGVSDALYWSVVGMVVSVLATVLNAWVLLVEILR
jgi:hypothetical protein